MAKYVDCGEYTCTMWGDSGNAYLCWDCHHKRKLSYENRRLKHFFGKIGLPFDAPILPDSIHKMTCCSASGFMDFSQRFLVEFSCDMSVLSPAQRQQLLDGFKQV